MIKIFLKCKDPLVQEKEWEELKKLFRENKEKILKDLKNILKDDFIEKEVTVNLVSQVGSIVYGGTKENEDKAEIWIEIPSGEPKHVLNILGWELTFALAKKKAYEIFFDKYKDFTIADVFSNLAGTLVEKEIIKVIGEEGYQKTTIYDHASPQSPVLYKLQRKLIERWPDLKRFNSLSDWIKEVIKDFPSEIPENEITNAFLMKNQDIIIRTLHGILKELKFLRMKEEKERDWQVEI